MIPLSPEQCLVLASALPDTPQAVISISQLRQGEAQAFVTGNVTDFETAVIHDPGQPGEPMAFGNDPEQIADLLEQIPDWFCVNVAPEIAPRLGPLLAGRMNCPIRYYGDVYHTLTRSVTPVVHTAVHRLTLDDLPLLAAAPPEIRGYDPRRLLKERTAAGAIVAGAIVDEQIVAIAQNYALSARYGDIGVATLPDFRGQGLATAAASLVIQWVVGNGRIPVWSCGEDNFASLRVAQKLRFQETSRRVYIILETGTTS